MVWGEREDCWVVKRMLGLGEEIYRLATRQWDLLCGKADNGEGQWSLSPLLHVNMSALSSPW